MLPALVSLLEMVAPQLQRRQSMRVVVVVSRRQRWCRNPLVQRRRLPLRVLHPRRQIDGGAVEECGCATRRWNNESAVCRTVPDEIHLAECWPRCHSAGPRLPSLCVSTQRVCGHADAHAIGVPVYCLVLVRQAHTCWACEKQPCKQCGTVLMPSCWRDVPVAPLCLQGSRQVDAASVRGRLPGGDAVVREV
jgi:hypothetical protein